MTNAISTINRMDATTTTYLNEIAGLARHALLNGGATKSLRRIIQAVNEAANDLDVLSEEDSQINN